MQHFPVQRHIPHIHGTVLRIAAGDAHAIGVLLLRFHQETEAAVPEDVRRPVQRHLLLQQLHIRPAQDQRHQHPFQRVRRHIAPVEAQAAQFVQVPVREGPDPFGGPVQALPAVPEDCVRLLLRYDDDIALVGQALFLQQVVFRQLLQVILQVARRHAELQAQLFFGQPVVIACHDDILPQPVSPEDIVVSASAAPEEQ